MRERLCRFAVTLALVVAISAVAAPHTDAVALVPHPNVVIVLSDDQRWDKVTPTYMPNVYNWSQSATTFTDAIVPNPLCCPSRTSILTGDYSHTTGVWSNKGDYGGFGAFTDDSHTIAVDFQNAGYHTAMIGKYLNGYEPKDTKYVPPGWSRWFALRTGDYYNYDARKKNGKLVHLGTRARDYSSRVIETQAERFVTKNTATPFFMYLSFTAPHGKATPDKRDIGRFAGDPDCCAAWGPHASMLDAAYGVDRSFGQLLQVLPANTIILYMSDNGYLWGEHNLFGKAAPYEESTRVPLIIGGAAMSALPDDIVANVDLRPTLTDLAGIPMLTAADGIDLASSSYTPRDAIVLENRNATQTYSYCGVRERSWMYARYDDGSELMFDLDSDYSENDNLVATQPAQADKLRTEAEQLCSPPPPGYVW
ncbi:MAG TPA: sulfatase-like hydrolase/transferase [Actinomycetota bacterium]|nr:sulfatase-like hydrolase/transferase [Actinomycetota bacterium]